MGYFMNEGLGYYFMEVGDGFRKKLGCYFCQKGKRQYLVLYPACTVYTRTAMPRMRLCICSVPKGKYRLVDACISYLLVQCDLQGLVSQHDLD